MYTRMKKGWWLAISTMVTRLETWDSVWIPLSSHRFHSINQQFMPTHQLTRTPPFPSIPPVLALNSGRIVLPPGCCVRRPGTSLAVQWLRLQASTRGAGLILAQGTNLPRASPWLQVSSSSQLPSALSPSVAPHGLRGKITHLMGRFPCELYPLPASSFTAFFLFCSISLSLWRLRCILLISLESPLSPVFHFRSLHIFSTFKTDTECDPCPTVIVCVCLCDSERDVFIF